MFLEIIAMYNLDTINQIKDFFIAKNETLAIAESVTSGHIQAAVSLASMATAFFQGGVTAYNINQKTRLLNIDSVHALSCNCVSEKVASEMALNAAKLFKSHWAIAITGYAAPVPELGINELFAFWAACHQGEIVTVDKLTSAKDKPETVQLFYTNEVLKEFNKVLQSVMK
jgi:nicotinamide-nucleotide amidase